jgi:uncharacterized protein (TIRG00374 family)
LDDSAFRRERPRLVKNKRAVIVATVLLVLGALVYLQIHTWRHFDWAKFREGIEGINWWLVLLAVFYIYAADLLRAIRWKIFLKGTSPRASWVKLIAPQYVGFTGLALLGRPGEFIRPYLIAKRENLSVPSQMAIWFVERAFDIGAVTIILCSDLFLVPSMRENYPEWRFFGYGLIIFLLVFVVVLWLLARHGAPVAAWTCRRLSRFSDRFAETLEKKVRATSEGLHAVRDWGSFLEASVISVLLWTLVAMAYRQVTHAYPAITGLPDLELPEVILLMGASVAGGVVQLPVVGGGSQLATIAVLSKTFGYDQAPELAVSCGILLWLVTFMSVVPLGLALARYEHVSLRRISEESQESEKAAESTLAEK